MQLAIDPEQLVKSIIRDEFYSFVQEMWHSVIPEKPHWNWHIKYLCDELQTVAERVFAGEPKEYDLIINVPPGSTKSTLCSVLFPAWTWTRMPSARHLVATHGFDLGLDLSRKCRDVLRETEVGLDETDRRPGYPVLFPEIILREDQNTKGYFVNTKGGFRKAVTVGGVNPVGFHAHFILVDDPIDPQEAVSEVSLNKANDFMNRTLPTRKVDKAIAPTIIIQQRLHQNDPSGNRLSNTEAGPIKHICLPAACDDGYEVIPPALKSRYKDGLLDPVRIPKTVLKEAKAQLGSYGYAGQYGQSPVPASGGMFEVNRITVAIPPKISDFVVICRFWDKAATVKKTSDYTAGVLIGKDNSGRFWILNVVHGRWNVYDRERTILQTAKTDGKSVIVGIEQEPGASGLESAQATVRMLAGFRTKIIRPTGDKSVRAEPFASQMGGDNIFMVDANWNTAYLDELRFFPQGTHDDMVDGSSGAFNIVAKTRRKVGGFGASFTADPGGRPIW